MVTPKELEDRIRVRAHEIWEREGRTYGNHEGHWHRAKEIEEEEQAGLPKDNHRKAPSRR